MVAEREKKEITIFYIRSRARKILSLQSHKNLSKNKKLYIFRWYIILLLKYVHKRNKIHRHVLQLDNYIFAQQILINFFLRRVSLTWYGIVHVY